MAVVVNKLFNKITKTFPILLGNFLEFYDFTLFAALLPIIAPILFPSKEMVDSFISGYLFMAIGFLARPIGAVFFGYIGDHYSRKRALIIAVLTMSIATLSMGCLPSYQTIGSYALVILAICRFFQGLSAGGEYSGAGLALAENARKENQFLSGAILTSSGLFGAFAASIMAASISIGLFPKQGWRLLFLIGGCIGFLTLWLRLSMQGSSDQQLSAPVPVRQPKIIPPWSILFKEYRSSVLCTISFGALMNIPFYLITGFINTYFVATGAYTRTTLMLINALVILFCAFITILFGLASKRFNPLRMMFYSSLGMSLFAFPFFFMIHAGSLVYFITAELLLIVLSQMFVAPAFTTMAHLFPYALRYRGVAVGACIGLAFLGGLTPYISAHLIRWTNLPWSPAFYLFFVSVVGFYCVTVVSKRSAKSSNSLAFDYDLTYAGA